MYLKLAWRNLWRNKRRTLITAASVFFAVILATFIKSLKEGTYDKMIENVVGVYTGYIQIHQKGYWDEQLIDNSFVSNHRIDSLIGLSKDVPGSIPRLESFALTSSHKKTKGALVIGTDPEKEDQLTHLKSKLTAGSYFKQDDKSVLVGEGLAEYLKLAVNDTIVILGSGYHGANAAAKYPITGIIKMGSPDLNKQLVYLPLSEAQYLFNAENRLTSLVLQVTDPDEVEHVTQSFKDKLGAEYEVMSWQEMLPELQQTIEWDTIEGYVFSGILYMLIAFGIFGTILMMISERLHEFGVLVAVGMKRFKLSLILILEIIITSLMGALAGIAAILPLLIWFNRNPIQVGGDVGKVWEDYGFEPVLQSSVDPQIFIMQALIVFIIAFMVSLIPNFKVLTLDSLEAMRS